MSVTLQQLDPQEHVALEQVESVSPDRSAAHVINGLRVAAWLGLIVGMVEAGVQLVQCLRGTFIGVDPQFIWMAPLAESLVYTVLAMPLLVLFRRLPNNLATVIVSGFLVFLGVYGSVSLIGGLHSWAILIVSFGVAVQTTRLAKAHTDGYHILVRRTLPWMLGFFVVGGVTMTLQRWNQEAAAVSALPPVSPLTSPATECAGRCPRHGTC
jgi:hypothetical protein